MAGREKGSERFIASWFSTDAGFCLFEFFPTETETKATCAISSSSAGLAPGSGPWICSDWVFYKRWGWPGVLSLLVAS